MLKRLLALCVRRCVHQPPFIVPGKNATSSLALLRIANALLKRLSKSEDYGGCAVVHALSLCELEPVDVWRSVLT